MSKLTVDKRAGAIKMILLDVDGVLTDGTVIMHGDGTESKAFHIRDGAAMVWATHAGLTVGLLSARSSPATSQRAAQLGIRLVSQGVQDKAVEFSRLVAEADLSEDAVAYMGDDLLDLPVFARAGLAAAPADAAADVRDRAHWVSQSGGGRGAVREFIEMILRSQGRWTALVETYTA